MGCQSTTKQWLEQIDELAMAAGSARPLEQDAYIVAMSRILSACPASLQARPLDDLQQEEVYGFMRLGAYADAVLALLPARAGVMTSSVGREMYCASVRLEGQPREATATASTFALALIAALASSYVAMSLDLLAA